MFQLRPLAFFAGASCPSHAVDEVAGVLGGVELNDPGNVGDVDSTGGHIRAHQQASILRQEAVVHLQNNASGTHGSQDRY